MLEGKVSVVVSVTLAWDGICHPSYISVTFKTSITILGDTSVHEDI